MASFKAIAQHAPVRVVYIQNQAAGTAVDNYVFVNPTGSNEYFEVVEVSYAFDVAGGASAAADVKISASGTSLASGTSALAAACDLTQTADTPYKATVSSTASARLVKPGDKVGVDTSGTLTGLVGLCIVVTLKPIKVVRTH